MMTTGDTTTGKPSKSQARPKRMTVFRDAEPQCDLDQHYMEFVGVDDSVQAAFGRIAAAGMTAGLGETVRMLFTEPADNGLSLGRAWFKSGYIVPRHSHSADCVYYVLAGELHMGTSVLKAGDGVFIPADSGYTFQAGPEGVEILEFRNATHFNIHFKGNDEAHWGRMEDTVRTRAEKWRTETPPSAH